MQWSYPRGALRVLLKGPEPRFVACLRLGPDTSGAVVYVEGPGGLVPAPSAGARAKCYESHAGIVAVYVEARPGLQIRKEALTLAYSVGPHRQRHSDSWEGESSQFVMGLNAENVSRGMIQPKETD